MTRAADSTVLVVEDNPLDAKLAGILLQLAGYEFTVVTSAEAALAQLAVRTPRLLLVDIDLPGMSGLELAEKLRADPSREGLPILAMSSTAGSDAPALSAAAGCDGFVAKPFDVKSFPAHLHRWAPKTSAS